MQHESRIGRSIDLPPQREPLEGALHRSTAARRPRSMDGRLLARKAIAGAALVAATGCATHDANPAQQFRIEPVYSVSHSVQSATSSQAYYTLGRYFGELHEWGRAADAYRQAVAADTSNVKAYDALGIALAQARHYAEAEATLRQAVALAPEQAQIRNNLGYTLLLEGRPADAMQELKLAVAQDGANIVARANLREAMARAGVPADVAVAATAPDGGKPVAAPVPNSPDPVVDVPAPGRQTPDVAASTPAASPPAIAARDQSDSAAGATQAVTAAQATPPVPAARLEVSNGNGVTGMASHVGQWLAARGMAADRLTNQQPFVQRQTVIQYRAGHEDAARRLAALLPASAATEARPTADLRSDVRVVLGRDWAPLAPCLARTTCSPAVATAATTVAMAARR